MDTRVRGYDAVQGIAKGWSTWLCDINKSRSRLGKRIKKYMNLNGREKIPKHEYLARNFTLYK